MYRRSLIGLAVALSAGAVLAQSYPNKPVRLVVPFAPGGTTDIIARVMADPLSRALGQPVVVENKSGGGGIVGAAETAKATPDGYALGIATVSTTAANPAINTKTPYNPLIDFTPIINIAATPNIIAVHPSFAAKDYASFLSAVKKAPGQYSFASSGTGGIAHLQMELYKNLSGTFITHIPYRGAAPAMQDVMGGQVPCMFLDLAAGLPVIQSGKVRALAIGSSKRMAALPDVPTLAEAGVPDTEVFAFQGILAPAGLPAAITTRLNADLNKALLNPAVVKRMNDFGMEALPGTPEQFRAMARADSKRWGEIIKAAGVKLD